MPFLRNVVKDLVDKRLWPVALLLVGALVAAPLLLGRSSGESAAPPIPATTPGANATTALADDGGAASKAVVTLDTGADAPEHLGGKVRDPFREPKATVTKKTAETGDANATAAPATTGGSSAAPSVVASPDPGTSTPTPASSTGTGSSDTTSGATGTTKAKATPKTKTTTTAPTAEDTTDTYHVSVRFRVEGGKLTTIRDVARLSPLPSVTDPFFVYLGVLKVSTSNTKRAVFIVSSDATPNGEGACHPTKQDCEAVELTVGQTAYFDATAPDGKVTQYELQLAGIHKTAVKSEAKASAAFARHSVAGAELLRDGATQKVRSAAAARAYRYLPGAGLLVRAKRKHVAARAAAAGTLVPGLALLGRKHQPGIPVWHSPAK